MVRAPFILEALDGIMFIDEAYALHKGGAADKGDPLGDEIVTTLLTGMENDRDRLIVIAAGYRKEMDSFMDTNPGLASRFKTFVHFPDFTPDELLEIFEMECRKGDYRLGKTAKLAAMKTIEKIYENRTEHFGNGRAMRNLFEECEGRHARRIFGVQNPDSTSISEFEAVDIGEEYADLSQLGETGIPEGQVKEVSRLVQENLELLERLKELDKGQTGNKKTARKEKEGHKEEGEFMRQTKIIREKYLNSALEEAANSGSVTTGQLMVAQFQAALTSCIVAKHGHKKKGVEKYKKAAESVLQEFIEQNT